MPKYISICIDGSLDWIIINKKPLDFKPLQIQVASDVVVLKMLRCFFVLFTGVFCFSVKALSAGSNLNYDSSKLTEIAPPVMGFQNLNDQTKPPEVRYNFESVNLGSVSQEQRPVIKIEKINPSIIKDIDQKYDSFAEQEIKEKEVKIESKTEQVQSAAVITPPPLLSDLPTKDSSSPVAPVSAQVTQPLVVPNSGNGTQSSQAIAKQSVVLDNPPSPVSNLNVSKVAITANQSQPIATREQMVREIDSSPKKIGGVEVIGAESVVENQSQILKLNKSKIEKKKQDQERVVVVMTKKQKDAFDQGLPSPLLRSNRDIGWNRQVLPPNISQRVYDGSNIHLPPVMLQSHLDSIAFKHVSNPEETRVLRSILGKMSDIDVQNQDGNTLLMHSLYYNNLDAVIILLQHGANLNLKNNAGYYPIHLACYMGLPEAASIMIDHGSQINARDKSGSTPIMYAASSGNLDLVKILVDSGANLDMVNDNDLKAIDFAELSGQDTIATYIKAITSQGL